jgi:hypothetical protein
MHPYVMQTIAGTRQLDLLAEARRDRLANEARRKAPGLDVTVRFARDTDARTLDRLAALSERPVPTGRVLVASVRGEVIAAAAVEGGPAVYDPFRRTADAVSEICSQAKALRGRFAWLHLPSRLRTA